ncbi:hypothetical protein E2C01_049393 [Portunus trituberculatus]|uniref:Uncharacterized protein n=1 Tax=Portunus trituberculatus TaxID=210409 RepID=A0A5B7GEA8_PORTR|nr:hypothetical protein [Portunus trituberculatus]
MAGCSKARTKLIRSFTSILEDTHIILQGQQTRYECMTSKVSKVGSAICESTRRNRIPIQINVKTEVAIYNVS